MRLKESRESQTNMVLDTNKTNKSMHYGKVSNFINSESPKFTKNRSYLQDEGLPNYLKCANIKG